MYLYHRYLWEIRFFTADLFFKFTNLNFQYVRLDSSLTWTKMRKTKKMLLHPSTCKCNNCMVKSSWPGEKLIKKKIQQNVPSPSYKTHFKHTWFKFFQNHFFSIFISLFSMKYGTTFWRKTYIHASFVLSLLSHPHTLCHVIFNACLRSFHTKYLMHISVCFIFAPPKPEFNVNTILLKIILCLMI